jgi:hypothetical protein
MPHVLGDFAGPVSGSERNPEVYLWSPFFSHYFGLFELHPIGMFCIAGYLKTLVLDNRTAYHGYFEFLRLDTGFELSSSWTNVSCYGPNRNRSGLIFMKIFRLASGHRISTVFNGQNHFFKIAGSKVLDE